MPDINLDIVYLSLIPSARELSQIVPASKVMGAPASQLEAVVLTRGAQLEDDPGDLLRRGANSGEASVTSRIAAVAT